MKIVHSIWTKPMLDKQARWGVSEQLRRNLWYFAASVACVQRIGLEIELHTDCEGKDIFGFIPYGKIHTTLENFNAPSAFWAAGKLETQKYIRKGDIHI